LREKIAKVINRLPREENPVIENEAEIMKIAFVGRRNTGKSSFVNALARQERVIVSEIEGTTRDSVDVEFLFKGTKFIAIDTAGVRRKRSVENTFEFYSQSRSFKSVRRADVIILMLDATEEIADLDKKLASRAVELIKPVIICVNKWDLILDEKVGVPEFEKYIRSKLPGLNFAPISFTSVLENINLENTIELAQELWEQTLQRINTGELNRIITAALERKKPPRLGTRRAKIYYSTQVDVNPPTIVLFVNDPFLFPNDYKRYIVNQLRESSVFPEIPIKIIFKAKIEEDPNN
jgi:GTP-binding protein